jgi:hypothetical protein
MVPPRIPTAKRLITRATATGNQFLAATTATLGRLHSDIQRLTNSSKSALRAGLVWSAVATGSRCC